MTLRYELKFYDYWHLSSGLSGGAKLDSLVIKDDNNLPYAPGKTIKGLCREMAELLNNNDFVVECFGSAKTIEGSCYFSNATLNQESVAEIVPNNLQDHLYDILSFTEIDNDGIAKTGSLREIEVVIPVTLNGEILNVEAKHVENMKLVLRMVKRMGLNRHRGLGRCEFVIKDCK